MATASQALRNDRNSSRATCERVQRIAGEMGYRPDPLLAQLASRRFRRSTAIAGTPVVFATHAQLLPPQRYWRYLDELKICSGQHGYVIVHEPIESAEHLRKAARRWYHKGVRGVVFGMFEHDDWIEAVDWSAFSVVFLGGRCPRTLFNTVKTDAVQGLVRTLDLLAAEVVGPIGVVLHRHERELKDDLMREGAVRTWIERLPPERRVPIHFEEFVRDEEEQRQRLGAWLRRYRPDGITGFSVVKWQAESFGYLPAKGRRFMSFIQDWREGDPGLVGAVEPIMGQASRAMVLLDGMIRHGEVGMPARPVEILVPPEWMAPSGSVVVLSGR